MTQEERLDYLIRALLAEREEYKDIALPDGPAEKRRLLRALVNVRPPEPLDRVFYQVQDAYLQEELRRKGVTRLASLTPVRPGLYLWQGDITTLAADAIVNAANSAMLGCFVPCHGCIDNAIHTAAGFQLRRECARMMALRPGGEPPARACGALGLHQRGHRGRFGTVVNVKTAGGWEPCRRFCCVMRLFWLLLGARCARGIPAGCASAAGQSAAPRRAGRRPSSWLRLPGLKDRPSAEISGQHRYAVQRLGRDSEGVLPEDHEVGQ